MLCLKGDILQSNSAQFLIDTGANISLISQSVLTRLDGIDQESTLSITSSAGVKVPIIGSVSLTLTLENKEWPPFSFWVTPVQFTCFQGILGTDVLSQINAIIDYNREMITIEHPRIAATVNFIQLEEASKIQGLTFHLNSGQKRKALQVVALDDQEIPANTKHIIWGRIQKTPFLNMVHEVKANTLHAEGVLIARAWVKLQSDGTVPVSVINLTQHSFWAKAKQPLSLCFPMMPDECPILEATESGIHSTTRMAEANIPGCSEAPIQLQRPPEMEPTSENKMATSTDQKQFPNTTGRPARSSATEELILSTSEAVTSPPAGVWSGGPPISTFNAEATNTNKFINLRRREQPPTVSRPLSRSLPKTSTTGAAPTSNSGSGGRPYGDSTEREGLNPSGSSPKIRPTVCDCYACRTRPDNEYMDSFLNGEANHVREYAPAEPLRTLEPKEIEQVHAKVNQILKQELADGTCLTINKKIRKKQLLCFLLQAHQACFEFPSHQPLPADAEAGIIPCCEKLRTMFLTKPENEVRADYGLPPLPPRTNMLLPELPPGRITICDCTKCYQLGEREYLDSYLHQDREKEPEFASLPPTRQLEIEEREILRREAYRVLEQEIRTGNCKPENREKEWHAILARLIDRTIACSCYSYPSTRPPPVGDKDALPCGEKLRLLLQEKSADEWRATFAQLHTASEEKSTAPIDGRLAAIDLAAVPSLVYNDGPDTAPSNSELQETVGVAHSETNNESERVYHAGYPGHHAFEEYINSFKNISPDLASFIEIEEQERIKQEREDIDMEIEIENLSNDEDQQVEEQTWKDLIEVANQEKRNQRLQHLALLPDTKPFISDWECSVCQNGTTPGQHCTVPTVPLPDKSVSKSRYDYVMDTRLEILASQLELQVPEMSVTLPYEGDVEYDELNNSEYYEPGQVPNERQATFTQLPGHGDQMVPDMSPLFQRNTVTEPFELADEAKEGTKESLETKLVDAAQNSQAPESMKGKLRELLMEYRSIFRQAGDRTHSCPLYEQAIPLMDDRPVCVKQYDLPRAARDALKDRITEFLDAGIIKPSNSGYNSPVWMVPKKDGTWRMCIDFRELNKKILHDPFPLPKIDELIEEFRDAEYISAGDMFWGFYHIRVKPEDTYKLAFSTNDSRYEFLQLPMGLKTAPAVFQRLMNLVFASFLKKTALVYMDDMIIYSKNAEQHMTDLRQIFERMSDAGLRFKIEKCQFFQKELQFLGVIISKEGIKLDPKKVQSVRDFPRPNRDLGQLQSFLGLVGYFKRHIPNYAVLAKPLYNLMKGEDCHKKKRKGQTAVPFKQQAWGPEQEQAFNSLKDAATSAPVLAHPDFQRDFIVTTDASSWAIGYVLSQNFDDGEHPIAYGSRQLKGAELNYSNTDREMLAVVKGVEHFRTYLYGKRFLIRTDHQALALINKGKPTTQRVCKWLLEMNDYDFTIEYVPATKIRHADALSRIRLLAADEHDEHTHPGEMPTTEHEVNMLLGADQAEWEPLIDYVHWGKAQRLDSSLKSKFESAEQQNDTRWALHDGVLYARFDHQYVPIVPTAYRQNMLRLFHGPPTRGHLGPERTFHTMKRQVTWPGMKTDVFEYIAQCKLCQYHKRHHNRIPQQPQCIPTKPFHTVTMDVVGPVPKSQYGDQYILVIQDLLTRWVEMVPMKRTDAITIMTKLRRAWLTRYGFPIRLLTDRAREFTGTEMSKFCNFHGIEKVHTVAYRPQGNGVNERMHQEVTKYISMYLDGQKAGKWYELLDEAKWVCNSAYHGSLGMSPYEALFGELPFVGAVGIPQVDMDNTPFKDYYGMKRRQLIEKRKAISENLLNAQNRSLKIHNKHARPIPFQAGDFVLYKNFNPRHKWDRKFLGPFRIMERLSPVVFELEVSGKRFSAHATQLKAFRAAPPQASLNLPTTSNSDSENDSDSDSDSDGNEALWIPSPAYLDGNQNLPSSSTQDLISPLTSQPSVQPAFLQRYLRTPNNQNLNSPIPRANVRRMINFQRPIDTNHPDQTTITPSSDTRNMSPPDRGSTGAALRRLFFLPSGQQPQRTLRVRNPPNRYSPPDFRRQR